MYFGQMRAVTCCVVCHPLPVAMSIVRAYQLRRKAPGFIRGELSKLLEHHFSVIQKSLLVMEILGVFIISPIIQLNQGYAFSPC